MFQGKTGSWVVDANATVVQNIPHKVLHIVHHPKNINRLLAVACSEAVFDARRSCRLFTSEDGGQALDSVDSDVYVVESTTNLGWALPEATGFDENLIFYVRILDMQMLELVKYHLTTKQKDSQVVDCAAYAQRHEFMFAAQVTMGLSFTGARLLISANNGNTWTTVQLPNDDPQFRFTIVDASEHMMFLNIYHKEGSTWGSTYSSDTTGACV